MPAFRDNIYSVNGSATGFPNPATLATLAAGGGNAIPVTLGFCRRMEIRETFAAAGTLTPLGLQVKFWNRETGAWGPTLQYAPNEIVIVDDSIPEGMGQGSVLGLPAQATFFPDARGTTTRAADTPVQIISGAAGTTLVKVREYQ